VESADRESRRLDILSVKKEANLSARYAVESRRSMLFARWHVYITF